MEKEIKKMTDEQFISQAIKQIEELEERDKYLQLMLKKGRILDITQASENFKYALQQLIDLKETARMDFYGSKS
jgi:hypothetical protein